ncbi:helix-turn-helix domain-containing protein [Povalibacter sp.]|uniref:TetR/AcrR family transcriptional regulator n=1 Tax=Povalibacter sp. TaxID=1962978 RepID=UPI002F415456
MADAPSARERRVRRKRDPEGTREAILEAAREVLAQDGKEGLSVAQVAQRAGVNRGTAYQHFQTREQLIEATATWVSEKLYKAIFGDPAVAPEQPVESIDVEAMNRHLAGFAMENPALGRVWLLGVLSSRRPANDPFWRQYESSFKRFAATELAQSNIDAEVLSVLILASTFIWPVWARAHARTAKERQQMADRFTSEIRRLCLHGTMRPEKKPQLDARRAKRPARRTA